LLNLLHYPTSNFMFGGELQWGARDNADDGFSVDQFRFQFSVKSNYSFKFGRETGVVSR
jgi:hypothetical protein